MDFLTIKMAAAADDDLTGKRKPSAWDAFRFDLVFDWVELEFELASRTHFRHVRKELAAPFAEAIDKGPGACTTHFRVKFHDVTRYGMLVDAVRQLRHRWGLVGPVKVSAVELAADLYLRSPQGEADKPRLAELAANWYQCMDTVVHDNRRLYRSKYDQVDFNIPADVPALAARLLDGWQLGMGHRTAPVYQHLYLKMTDQNGKPIDPNRYRARLELRISGDDGWRHFGWPGMPALLAFEELRPPTKLTKHFYRRIDTGGYEPDPQLVLPAMPQPLRRWEMRRRKGGGVKAYPRGSRADLEFNKRMHAAFRLLRGVWKRSY